MKIRKTLRHHWQMGYMQWLLWIGGFLLASWVLAKGEHFLNEHHRLAHMVDGLAGMVFVVGLILVLGCRDN